MSSGQRRSVEERTCDATSVGVRRPLRRMSVRRDAPLTLSVLSQPNSRITNTAAKIIKKKENRGILVKLKRLPKSTLVICQCGKKKKYNSYLHLNIFFELQAETREEVMHEK